MPPNLTLHYIAFYEVTPLVSRKYRWSWIADWRVGRPRVSGGQGDIDPGNHIQERLWEEARELAGEGAVDLPVLPSPMAGLREKANASRRIARQSLPA
jgi:hypothetical protein